MSVQTVRDIVCLRHVCDVKVSKSPEGPNLCPTGPAGRHRLAGPAPWAGPTGPVQVRQSISLARARAASLLGRASGQVARVCVRVRVGPVSRGPEAVCRFGVDSVERVARLTEMRPGLGFQPRRLALHRARQGGPSPETASDLFRRPVGRLGPQAHLAPPKGHRDRPAGPGPSPLGHLPGPVRRPEIGPGSSGPLAEQGAFPCPCAGPGWNAWRPGTGGPVVGAGPAHVVFARVVAGATLAPSRRGSRRPG